MNLKIINQLVGLEINIEFCIVLLFVCFFLELNNNAKSESLRILTPFFFTVDYRSVQ